MCSRNNLVNRRVTSVGQKVPKNAVETAEQFLEVVNLQILQTWMKLHVTLIFLDLQLLTKKGYRQLKLGPQVGASSFHGSFNSRSKENRKWIHPLSTSSIIDI